LVIIKTVLYEGAVVALRTSMNFRKVLGGSKLWGDSRRSRWGRRLWHNSTTCRWQR